MKVKRSMSSRIAQKREQLELKLLEAESSWLDNIVDPRDAYIDDVTGESWRPLGGNGMFDEESEPFRTEDELTWIRRKSRSVLSKNPYAENLLKNLIAFTIGKGHNYCCSPKDGVSDVATARKLAKKLQMYVDRLLKYNKWKKRQKEAYRRLHRDGEVFYRIFPQKHGYCRFRFVEPSDIYTPTEWSDDESADFGIKTDPEDVETIEWYFVNGEEVSEHLMQHRKINVDMNCKRGLSSLYCVMANLDRAGKLLRNMSTVVEIQSSIAMIRKHTGTSTAVRNFVSNQATFRRTNQETGETRNYKKIRPGSILDTKQGTEYEFPSIGLNPAAPVGVLSAELRAIASSQSQPEYMVGSDASNANYSSTMVAESPAVRHFEQEQEEVIEMDLELIWTSIEYAIDAGLLPPEIKQMVEILVEAPKLVARQIAEEAQSDDVYMRTRVKSPQTVAGELGLKYEREQRNWREFDDANPDLNMLPTAGQPVPGGGY